MNEPEALLADMITLDAAYEAIKEAHNGNKDN
jgi:hypothetical protein